MSYKEMYKTMVSETEKAINILIAAQQKCEDMYIRQSEDEKTETENNEN